MRLDLKRKISPKKIKELRREIDKQIEYIMPYGVTNVEATSAAEAKNRIVESALNFLNESIYHPTEASFQIPSRSGLNVGFDEEQELVLIGRQMIERQFRSLSSVSSVEQLSHLMRLTHDILSRDHMPENHLFVSVIGTLKIGICFGFRYSYFEFYEVVLS